MIPIVKPNLPSISDLQPDIDIILNTGKVTNNGQYVQSFEAALQDYLSSKLKPICFCNGEMALFNLIQAHKIRYNIPDGSDVLVPSFTFVGTINAIELNGLKPVFCDVDETLTMSFFLNEQRNERLIIAVGVYGNLPNIEILSDISKKLGIPLIFDNAPAFGSKYKGQFPNHYGHSEIYSFHATKQLTTMEGGCAVVNDTELHQILIELRDFGQYEKTRGDIHYPGLNSKMQEISALMGIENLKRFENEIKLRSIIAKAYRDSFEDTSLKLMKVSENVFCNYLYFPIILPDNANKFVGYMADNEIQVRQYYTACHKLTYYKKHPCLLPHTESIMDRIVALPCYGSLTSYGIEKIIEVVKNYIQ